MKKRTLTIVCLLLTLFLLAGCVAQPDATNTPQPTEAPTDQTTEAAETATPPTPTEAPTPEETAPLDEDIITLFDAADIDAYMSYVTGLSNYGIDPPTLTAVDGGGVEIECPGTGWCQNFQITDADTIARLAAFLEGSRSCLKVAIENDVKDIQLRLTVCDSKNGVLSFDCYYAILVDENGDKPEVLTANGGGMGDDTAVVIPAYFNGYVILARRDLTLGAVEEWNRPDFNQSDLKTLEIDVRNADSGIYVLKSITAVDYPLPERPTTAPTEEPTPTAQPTAKPTASPKPTETAAANDPSKVTLMIEDFNNISSVQSALSPLDLSAYGIVPPEYSFEAEFALEGLAFVNTLQSAAWCQAYELRDSRLNVFQDAKSSYYLRLWVVTPDDTSVGLTVALGTERGQKRSFLDASKAIVTDYTGKVISCSTANDTSDAGTNSSIRIPEGFKGYVAFPLNNTPAWNQFTPISALTAVDYLKLDLRPSVAAGDDRYVLDALCISDSPVGQTWAPSANPTDQPTPEPTYSSKNAELDAMLAEVLTKEATFEYCPEYDPAGYPNIKAIWLDGVQLGTKDTKVFAYIGFPENASKDNKVPAVVLQHGGGGYAFPSWVKIWNDRGYAAIAICNTGYMPAKTGITDFYSASSWTHSIPRAMRETDPRVLPPDNDGMNSSTGKINRMWMYHAVAQTILANSLLRADERVDASKIGLTGISWGGVITAIAIGYDARFAFAVPVYGSGYLYEALSWMKNNFNSAGTKELWDASLKLKNVTMPVLWLCWTNDNCFSINSNSKSCADTVNGQITMLMNMGHGHGEGWSPAEIYRFADSVVKGGEPMTTCVTQPQAANEISFTVNTPADATSVTARVCYIKEKMTYSANGRLHIQGQDTIDQEWFFVDCTVSGNTISATIPSDAYSYYVEITTKAGGKNYVSCSQFIDIQH